MKKSAACFLPLCIASLALLPAAPATTVTQDALLFTIEKHPVEHQGPQVVDLVARLDYQLDIGPKDYPDFEEVYRKLSEWIKTYPNETDYWEPFNRALAEKILEAYPKIGAVTLELKIHPTYGIQYSHTSLVTVKR